MQMDEPVQQVTIVGGGTAGWLSAIVLQSRLNANRQGRAVKVTLIESPTIKIIGVGEGSLPALAKLMKSLGIEDAELARRCNTTFKLGVHFVGWNSNEAGVPYNFTHPFRHRGMIAGRNTLNYYLAFGPHKQADRFDAADSMCLIPEAIRTMRGPSGSQPNGAMNGLNRYGYHFDAMRLAEFLKEKSVARGVEHIVDDVDEVVVGEGGTVTHLRLKAGGLRPVEFVIDCTGFKGLVMSQALKEPFRPYSQQLLCDRAAALQIPYGQPDSLEACTRATALGAGWAWRVPLFNRIGTGYVYSSAFRTDEQAIEEFTRHLGVDPDKAEPRIIPMRVGRSQRAWVGNCVAVGLSSGFIEPLEATAIMTIQAAIRQLLRNFPNKSMQPALRDRYNRTMADYHDSVRDFISFHYYLANRDEPFWLAARAPSVLSDSLEENLAVWRHRLPIEEDLSRGGIFSEVSYGICLTAKGFYRGRRLADEPNLSPGPWQAFAANLSRAKSWVRSLPPAREYLAELRGETSPSRRELGDLSLAV